MVEGERAVQALNIAKSDVQVMAYGNFLVAQIPIMGLACHTH